MEMIQSENWLFSLFFINKLENQKQIHKGSISLVEVFFACWKTKDCFNLLDESFRLFYNI